MAAVSQKQHASSLCEAPSLTPRRHRLVNPVPKGRGRAGPTRKEAGSRDSGTPRRCAARFDFSVNPPVSRGASSEPRAEVARGYPNLTMPLAPSSRGLPLAVRLGLSGKRRRRRAPAANAKAPGLPSAAMAPRGLRGRAWRPVSPRHCLFRPAQAFDSRPHSATFPPRVRGGIAGK